MGKYLINTKSIISVRRYECQNPCWHCFEVRFENPDEDIIIKTSTYEGSVSQYNRVKMLDDAYDEAKKSISKGLEYIELVLP